MLFYEGHHPKPGKPAKKCYRFTFGVPLNEGQEMPGIIFVTPCVAQGEAAEFVFGDTVDGIDTQPDGFGVPLLSPKLAPGANAIRVLAGEAIPAGSDIIVGMKDFTVDGATVSLPVAFDAANADDGDTIIASLTLGNYSTAADTDVNSPSLTIEFKEKPIRVSGEITSSQVISLPISLAAITADGDVVTDWTPTFAGTIKKVAFQVTVPVTTAAKAATLNLEINAVDVTGGVVALTSANATPLGKVIAGTAVTANNTFDANDTVSVEATGVTAFAEGEGTLLITVEVTPA